MNQHEDFSIISFDDICRTCLIQFNKTNLYRISKVKLNGSLLSDIIARYTSIQVFANNFPKGMCKNCILNMYKINEFLNICHLSNKKLEQILNSSKIDIEDPEVKENCNEETFHEEIADYELTPKCEGSFDVDIEESIYIKFEIEENQVVNDIPADSRNDMNQLVNTSLNGERVSSEKRSLQLKSKNKMESNSGITKTLAKRYQNSSKLCIICREVFEDSASAESHRQQYNHFKRGAKSCMHCPYKTVYSGKLRTHLCKHSGLKNYRCEICLNTFTYVTSLRRHERLHSGEAMYTCTHCQKGFTRIDYYKIHLRKHDDFVCTFCGKMYQCEDSLRNHEKIHGIFKKTRPRKAFTFTKKKCTICNKLISTYDEYNAHRLAHVVKCSQCELCGKQYTKTGLAQHIRKEHSSHKYTCEICETLCSSKYDLNLHYETHVGFNFTCEVCGMNFKTSNLLVKHAAIHNRVKKFFCTLCPNRGFYQKAKYNMHMLIHTGEKPFACTICNKSFNQKSNLDIHFRIHTGETPYKCANCSNQFKDSHGLRRHNRKCKSMNS